MEPDREPSSTIMADGMEVDDTPEQMGAFSSKDVAGEPGHIEDGAYEDGDAEMEGDNEEYEEYYEAQEGEGDGFATEGEEGVYESTADDAMNIEEGGEGVDEDAAYHEDTEEYEEYTEEMEAEHMAQSKPDTSTSASTGADTTANTMIAGLTETPELATSRATPANAEAEGATENAAEAAAEPLGPSTQDGAEGGIVAEDPVIEESAAVSETEAAKSAIVSGLRRTSDAADSLHGGSNVAAGDDAGTKANDDGHVVKAEHTGSDADADADADASAQADTGANEDMEDEEEGEEEETLDELLTVHTLPPVLVHPPTGPPKLLFWTPDDHEVYADVMDAELDILLENQHEAYGDAKLDVVFGKIKQEIADHVGVPLGVEMVLEEQALGLKMGEHDKHLSQVTLLELLQVHHSCELPLPVHFYLSFEPSRFYDRFEAIRRELVVQAERRKLGEQQEQDEYVLGEGDVGDDEGYESGEDAEEDEEEYEEGDEEGGAAAGDGQAAPTDQPNDSAAVCERSAAHTGGETQAPAETDKGVTAGTADLPLAHEFQGSTAEMSHIPEDPSVPLDAAALEELHERQDLEQDLNAQTDYNDPPVIVPDEVTGEYDEDSEMPEGHVPAEIDKAIDANAPEADATLAPEADESELQGDELADSNAGVQETYDDAVEGADADGDADVGEADAGEADGLVEGDDDAGSADVYEDEDDDGDNIEAIADKLVGDAEEELRMEDEGVNNVREAFHDGVIGEEAAQEVLGDDFVVADGDKTPVYSANVDLNPFDSYDADGAAADDFDDENDAGDDAGDNAELDEGYETGTEHSVTGSKRFRPDGEEDEDGEVPGKKYKV